MSYCKTSGSNKQNRKRVMSLISYTLNSGRPKVSVSFVVTMKYQIMQGSERNSMHDRMKVRHITLYSHLWHTNSSYKNKNIHNTRRCAMFRSTRKRNMYMFSEEPFSLLPHADEDQERRDDFVFQSHNGPSENIKTTRHEQK